MAPKAYTDRYVIRTRPILWGVVLLGMLPLCAGCQPLPICANYSAPVCHDAGVDYEQGAVGYEQSKKKALSHYQAACRRGLTRSCQAACKLEDAASCNRLGLLVVRRRHHRQWRKRARSAFGRACDLGSATGCGNVAKHLLKGRQTEANLAQAKAYFTKACDGGFQRACADLGKWAAQSPAEPVEEPKADLPKPEAESPAEPAPQEPKAPEETPACAEAREFTWIGFGSIEMVWCGSQFLLRTLGAKEQFRIASGAQGADAWVHVGDGGKAVCVDFLAARLGEKGAQSARCYAIEGNTGFPAVESDETATKLRFAGAVWHVSAQGDIVRMGTPVLGQSGGRFELSSARPPSK